MRVATVERDAGASSVEYGLMLAAVAAVITAVVFALGAVSGETFTDSCSALANEFPSGTTCP